MSSDTSTPSFANMGQEQLPIPRHKLHGWTHFVGLYAAEHVAATEFVLVRHSSLWVQAPWISWWDY